MIYRCSLRCYWQHQAIRKRYIKENLHIDDIMVNYQDGKYKIWDVGYTKCYIGSTCEKLSKRFSRHKSTYKDFKEKKGNFVSVFYLFEEFGIDNSKIELLENYPCKNKEELLKQEGHHQKENICVNKNTARGKDITEYQQMY